jgi:hypothetical protein
VRDIAIQFGKHLGIEPTFASDGEGTSALLNDAARAQALFGLPTVSPPELIEAIASWIQLGGATLNKPTHFQTRDGKF